MIEHLKDWIDNPREKARAEAELAIKELINGVEAEDDILKDIPNEIRNMIANCQVIENDFCINAIGCQTPIKVRIEVKE